MRIAAAIAILALGFSGAAHASRCYSATEAEAEMVIRLHSELMVSAISCRYSSKGEDLPKAYQAFTQNNLSLIKSAERKLINWGGKSNMDKLRTKLGNAYSQEIANLKPQGYCQQYRDRAAAARTWSPSQVASQLSQLAAVYRPQNPVCGMKVASVDRAKKKQN